MLRRTLLILILGLISLFIAGIFWNQEIKYQLPTPQPANYRPVTLGEKVYLNNQFKLSENKPILIHFFNPGCPCSKFNIEHFNEIVKKYKSIVDIYVVVKTDDDIDTEDIKKKFSEDVKVLLDADDQIANNCGVYATPQGVLIDKDRDLYYRGNYNKSRYCTSKESNYVDMAIDSLLAGKKYPVFESAALIPYGCEIPKK